jgi:hypothetical protein
LHNKEGLISGDVTVDIAASLMIFYDAVKGLYLRLFIFLLIPRSL